MNYQMYPNNQFYLQDLQNKKEFIENQIKQIQQNQNQPQQIQQPITQNFQITPAQNNNELEGRYADSIEAVKNTFVMKTGLFINKEMNTLWIKDVSGNVRTFDLQEIVEMDEKDKKILALEKEIEEMKGMINNAESVNTNVDDEIAETKPTRISANKRTNAK